MKISISPPIVIAILVVVVAIVVAIGVKVSGPKGIGDAKAALAQGHKGPLPQQPFIPKEGGGRMSPEEGGPVLGQTQRAPVVQGAGGMPQQPLVPGAR